MKDFEMILQDARIEGCEEACRIAPVLLQARAGKITMTDAYNQLITEGFSREIVDEVNEILTKCSKKKNTDIQQILSEIIPQLINLYKGHVVQIVQFKSDLAYINLAVLFDDSYTLTMHQSKIGKSRKLMHDLNEKYGPTTITIINCRYCDVKNPEKNSTHLYKTRNGHAIWTRKDEEPADE